MIQRAFLVLIVSASVVAGCGKQAAEFGPPKLVPADRHPTVWDAPPNQRLAVQRMESAAGGTQSGPRAWSGDTPEGWQAKAADPAKFRDAAWQVSGEPDTDCYLTAAVGGGTAMNLARWYSSQFGQQVPDADSLPAVTLAGRDGRLAEIHGTFQGKTGWAALIAFVASGDQVMSLKFTGPEAVVNANRAKFLALAGSVRSSGGAGSSSAAAGNAAGGSRVWVGTVPPGWETQPADPSRFRDAAWRVAGQPDTDCYLTAAVGGGVQMNLTRWYSSQFGQQVPAPEALTVIEFAGRTGRLADLKGTFQGKAGWAALIAFANQGDQVTSLKFTGPEAVVETNRANFLALAKSLRAGTASPDPNAPMIDHNAQVPPNHPGGNSAPPPPPTDHQPAAASPFTVAEVPAGWTAKAGSRRLLHYGFGNGSEVYVSQLSGEVKGTLEIWRSEMGLPPMTDAEFAALPLVGFLGDDATLLQLHGNYQGMSGKIDDADLVIAARRDGTTITFCKMLGPTAEVKEQMDAFRKFCASIRRAQ